MERVSLDEAKKLIDLELAKPLPGRRGRQEQVSQAVIDDEMALFRAAQTSKRG